MNRFKRSGHSSPQQVITILVLFSVLAVAALFTFALPTLQRYLMLKDADPIQTAEADLDEISTDGLYCIDDATVLDGYCYTGDSAEDASDFSYIVLFFTGDDQLAAASLTVTPEDDIWDSCYNYALDDSSGVGDLSFPLYASARDLTEIETQDQFFNEMLSDYGLDDLDITAIHVDLQYLGTAQADFQENVDYQLHSLLTQLCMIGVILITLILSAVVIIIIILRKKKEDDDDSDVIPGTPEIR